MDITQLINWLGRAWKGADALVAADAKRQGISKQEAWEGATAAAQLHWLATRELLADLADPLGWRSAAAALRAAA